MSPGDRVVLSPHLGAVIYTIRRIERDEAEIFARTYNGDFAKNVDAGRVALNKLMPASPRQVMWDSL